MACFRGVFNPCPLQDLRLTTVISGLLPEALAEVLVGAVGEDGDDDSRAAGGALLGGNLQAGDDRCCGRDADQQTFLARKALGHVVGRLGLHFQFTIGEMGL